MPPMQSPEAVAQALVNLAEHPARSRYVPKIAALGLELHRWLPNSLERLLLHALQKWHFDATPEPVTDGNLHASDAGTPAVHGERAPQTSSVRFALWTLAELFRMRLRPRTP